MARTTATRAEKGLAERALDADRMEKAHLKRLAIESSWLNYTRNAIIGSVSGIGLYQCVEVEAREDVWPAMLMLGAGFTFMAGGTVQYAVSLMAFEASQSMQAWGLANAGLAFACYSGGIYFFLQHAEERVSKAEAAKAKLDAECGDDDDDDA